MKINKTKLLFIATLLFLAIPLAFSGNAGATYLSDGATQNATTGGWNLPADGSCPADLTIKSRAACEEKVVNTDQAACTALGTTNYQWKTNLCVNGSGTVLSLVGQDRTAANCTAMGGTQTGAGCVGKWVFTGTYSGNDQCLRCHNSTVQYNSYAERWKETYLKTGHKNMLRAVTAGKNWAGPDGLVYTTDGTNSINFTNGTINVGGTDVQLFYLYGDWMAPLPSAIFANGVGSMTTAGSYSCAACHTTGYQDTANVGVQAPHVGAEPQATFPGISITGAAAGTSWDLNGIQCSRCHAATYPAVTGTGTHNVTPAGTGINNLCFGCHQSTTGVGTDPTKIPTGVSHGAAWGRDFNGHVLGNSFLNSPHAQFTGTIVKNSLGKYDIAGGTYGSHFAGSLCRTANFVGGGSIITTVNKSGVIEKIATSADCTLAGGYWVKEGTATRLSAYETSQAVCEAAGGTWDTSRTPPRCYQTPTPGSNQGNCTSCHDVHQSVVAAVGAEEPVRRECGIACHASKADFSTIKHPNTPGTPLGFAEESGNPSEACVVCHMATEAGLSFPAHLFRINTSASYDTFPTAAEFAAGNKLAKTAPDGTYANAVWVDLDMACGQCHGGSLGTDATKYGAPYMTKSYLAVVAKGMHMGDTSRTSPTAAFATGSPSAVGLAVTVVDASKNAETVKVNWGDGGVSGGAAAGTFTHAYKVAGTYPITLTAYNAENGLSNTVTASVSVKPGQYRISGTVTYVGTLSSGLPWTVELCTSGTEVAGTNCTVRKGAMVYIQRVSTGSTAWYQRNVGVEDSSTASYGPSKLLNSGNKFTVSATRANFTCESKTVTLTADTTVDITCTKNQ